MCEGETVNVCVCERERQREKEILKVFITMSKKDSQCVRVLQTEEEKERVRIW